MNFLNIVKKLSYTAALFATLTFSTAAIAPTHQNDPSQTNKTVSKVKIICLDAGHGGHDHGAVGRKAKEKDLTLEVVLKLGKRIEEGLPGVKVIYTRTTDSYPKLYERPELANKNKADLFISVHCNSADVDVRTKNRQGRYVNSVRRNPSAKGTETLICGFNRLDQQDVAIRENASILLEENYQDNYMGFDPKDPSSYIVFKLMKRQFRDQSIKLASYMQGEFSNASRTNRGVKEQGLAVLATAGMPAVLTEIGFISNPDEEEYMISDSGQKEIVENLFQAIKTYKNNVEK
ncbi:N-acetylmuramoyl-L-alanine amidase family protein [Sphingobacterium sp. Mn56C]|uniref:N-acetylmuramoyl-L-alanine amidase family protein n=1 Tax=Sphingobacterium sp. Mn56C TaxID=3395261 RepID=UPI003BD95304